MACPWAPCEALWRRKWREGKDFDFTVDTKEDDRRAFEKMGPEGVAKYKIMKECAPMPHQGDFAKCKVLFLLGHVQTTSYKLRDYTEEEFTMYLSNLLQRPSEEGKPIRAVALTQNKEGWIDYFEPILAALRNERGRTTEEARNLLEENMAMLQVHAYSTETGTGSANYEPPVLKETMDYSLDLARKAIERGVLVFAALRWNEHWQHVLGPSKDLRLLRLKRSFGSLYPPSRHFVDSRESTVSFDDLLDALCGTVKDGSSTMLSGERKRKGADQTMKQGERVAGAGKAKKSRVRRQEAGTLQAAKPIETRESKEARTRKRPCNEELRPQAVGTLEASGCGICGNDWSEERRMTLMVSNEGTFVCGHIYCNKCLEVFMVKKSEEVGNVGGSNCCPSGCDLGSKRPKLKQVYLQAL